MSDTAKITKIKEDLDRLCKIGDRLLNSLALDYDLFSPEDKKKAQQHKEDYLNFGLHYQNWYTEASSVVKQLIPERYSDFIGFYECQKRKEITYENYGVKDMLLGISINSRSVSPKCGVVKFQNQLLILKSAKKRFYSTLFDIKGVLQADLFDSDIESAKELNGKGFTRAAGALAGVVLEKHLSCVCDNHTIKLLKKKPCISDLNVALKNNSVIEVDVWRKIQYLGDLRNLCDHPGDEPTKEKITELIEGVDFIIKNLY